MMFCLYKQNKKEFVSIIGVGFVLSFIVMIWPFGDTFKGFIRIFIETAKVNSPWTAIYLPAKHFILFYLMLAVKMSLYLIVPIISIAVSYRIYHSENISNRKFKAVFLSGFILIYMFLSVSYSFSRIEWGQRISQTTSALAGLILFIYLLKDNSIFSNILKNKSYFYIFIAFILLIVFASRGSLSFPVPKNIFWLENNPFLSTAQNIVDGADYGMKNIGKGLIDKNFLAEEYAVKSFLDKILSKDETFLDLSNEGTHYFTSERKLWLEYPVNFVYPGNIPQIRAVKTLEEKNIKVSLLDNSTVFDMSPVNLRGYHLYRYALLNGLPIEISKNKTIIMPKEYFDKIGLHPPNKQETLLMLDKQFPQGYGKDGKTRPIPTCIPSSFPSLNFYNLPHIWGRGYKDFKDSLPIIFEFEKQQNPTSAHFYKLQNFNGMEAGLLYIDLNIDKSAELKISWINGELPREENNIAFIGHKGINLVPLDSAPRWLLAEKITSITISSDNMIFSIKEAKLLDRKNF
jgi:hypothetical protein